MEILINKPYTDGPGGSGQYTHKIYHVGSHLPGMPFATFRASDFARLRKSRGIRGISDLKRNA